MAGEFDAGCTNLQFLVGQRHRVIVAVALDVALDDLPITEQQDPDTVRWGGWRRLGGDDYGNDEQENAR